MLTNIRIHTFRNNLYFNLADIGKLLNRRPDSLVRSKYVVVKSFKINNFQPINYTNETSFRLLFKDNADILAELDRYKLTGEIAHSDKYSNLLSVAQAIVESSCASINLLKLPGNKEQTYESFKTNLHKEPVLQALILLYCGAVFYEQGDYGAKITAVTFTKYPVEFDLEYLYKIWVSGVVPNDLVLALKSANLKPIEINLQASSVKVVYQGILTVLNNRASNASGFSASDITELNNYFGLAPCAKLAKNWYEYPILTYKKDFGLEDTEILWLGK